MPSSNDNSSNHTASQDFAALGQFLKEDNWDPQQLESKNIYRLGFSGENGFLSCYTFVPQDLQQLIFYAVAPTQAPEAARPAVAEFITRANYGLRIGNFEMDFSDGEVRYKGSLDYSGTTLAPSLIRNVVYSAVATMDKYLPGLLSVIDEGVSPADAITAVEMG